MGNHLTLKIKPIRVRQTVYFRVPNDIADLIGLQAGAEVTLELKERDEAFFLTYAVTKSKLP